MVKSDKNIVITAPLRDVFDYVSQPGHFPTFLPITELTFITNMHRGIGTRLQFVFALGRKRIPTECNVTELEVDEHVSFRTTTGVACSWKFTFKEVEAGTQLRWEGEHELPVGFLDRLFGRGASVEQAMEATIEDGLQKLKETLESG
jgi:uncharacterized protein YndB with AHSA1/START domain